MGLIICTSISGKPISFIQALTYPNKDLIQLYKNTTLLKICSAFVHDITDCPITDETN